MRKPFEELKRKLHTTVIATAVLMMANPAFSNQLPYEREIDLKGTTNTRDIGGYQTGDLRTIKQGQIIRSENLSRLTANDFQKLEDIGVKTVIDLRTNHEHEKAPTIWLGDNPPRFFHFPVGDAENEWFQAQRKMMRKNRFTEDESLELMVDGYRMIANEGTPSYEKLMEVVLDESNWPVLIHCNAGKDRAGVAVTLIFEALGVDRETIMEEYLLTNDMGRSAEKAELMARESRKYQRRGKTPSAEAWYPVVGVQAEMLEAFYVSVDRQYGSMDVFLTELGVDQDARNALSDSLTTEHPNLVLGE